MSEVATNSNVRRLASFNDLIDDCYECANLCCCKGYKVEYLNLWEIKLKCMAVEVYSKIQEYDKIKCQTLFEELHSLGAVIQKKKTKEGTYMAIDSHKFTMKVNKLFEILEMLYNHANRLKMLIEDKTLREVPLQ